MSTPALERILAAVRSVESVDIVRIGTRTPVTMPMRVDDELVTMLRRYAPVWVNTHFNHPRELTPEARAACGRLVDAGIPVGNQSVLLRGINDDPAVMESLLRGLVRARVRPYYLYQCDLVRGVEHFRTPLGRGLQLMEYLRGRLSGLAIPSFVVDLPGGGGKIPLLPNYVVSLGADHTVLRNGEGMLVAYPDPGAPARTAPAPEHSTVYDLVSGAASAILPARTARHGRRAKRRAVRSAANLH
jgi:lysine 2,3-aminomutase